MKKSSQDTAEARSPVRSYRIAFLIACAVGACLSGDLVRLHVNVHTDPSFQAFCAVSEQINCETVALSEYSVFLGLPVAIWGLFGYLLMGALAIWGLRRQLSTPSWPFATLFWLSLFSTLMAVVLFAVSRFIIESICIVCAGTYLTSLVLLFFAFCATRQSGVGPGAGLRAEMEKARTKPVMVFASVMILLVGVTWLVVPPYWKVEGSTGPAGLPVGWTEDGHPWIGATQPQLEIIEFSDYQCPFCQRRHDELRELLQSYPEKIRLIHRNYPLDQACNTALSRPMHPRACEYARMVFCAGKQDRFWVANDYLFAEGRRREPITLQELSRVIAGDKHLLSQCLTDPETGSAIALDLETGRNLGIRGTPTYVVRGETHAGRIPPEVLMDALDIEQETHP